MTKISDEKNIFDVPGKKVSLGDLKEDKIPLYDYQKDFQDALFNKVLDSKNPCQEITMPIHQTIHPPTMSYTSMVKLMNQYGGKKPYLDDVHVGRSTAHLYENDDRLDVHLGNGVTEWVSREELIKYISERKVIQENEVVRKVYERYQVAVKLVRSDDNDDTGF
jgi:hypothetical protein